MIWIRASCATSSLVLLAASTLSPVSSPPTWNGRIAFVRGADVYTVTPDGAQVQQLTKLGPGSFAEMPSWEPNDEQIAYTVRSPVIQKQLWIMNANGRNQRRLLDDAAYGNTAGNFSPDGEFVIFSRCQARSHGSCAIYQVRIDGTGLSAITRFQSDVVDSFPVFSPDGGVIAFERIGADGVPGIYLIGADGSNLRRLTLAGVAAHHPSWSPDGSQIALSCKCSAVSGAAIWLIERAGGGFRQLSEPTVVDHLSPSWSPDGNFLAAEQRAPRTYPRVVMLDLAGTGPKKHLFKPLITGSQPSWSQAP